MAAGVGVTMMPRLALTPIHPGVVARDLTDRPRRKVWAARLETAYRSPASEAMLQILGDVAEEFPRRGSSWPRPSAGRRPARPAAHRWHHSIGAGKPTW